MKRSTGIIISILLPGILMAQGIKMTNVVTNYGEKEYEHRSTLYLTENRLKTEFKDQQGKKASIYKQDEEVLYTIDHKRKRYQKITKEDVEQMEKMMERMEQLPESSKDMMGERVKEMMENEQSEISYERTGKSKKVKPWGKCEEWKGTDEEGRLREKVYTTDKSNIEIREEHFQVLTGMIDFFSFMPEGMAKKIPSEGQKETALEGFGVLWVYFDKDEELTQKVRVKEMKETSFNDSLFDVPSNYEGSEMNMGGGRR